MRKVSVLLSDFQFLTREGLINMIEKHEDFDLVGVNDGPEGLLEMILDKHPDVLLLDYQSQDPVLITLLKKIIKSQATSILIITNDSNKSHIQNLLKMGIKGIVTKGCSKLEIINAIHSVSKNNRFFCNKVLDLVMATEPEEPNCLPTELSPRENEVLQLITKGMKTSDIADHLHVSIHTINSHRKNILKKLNLKSPAELIVFAMESGLVKS
ncbi:MAG: response regulator transcription factor [Cyclobacteriaceae bacterium]